MQQAMISARKVCFVTGMLAELQGANVLVSSWYAKGSATWKVFQDSGFFHHFNDYMQAGLVDSKFGHQLNKTETKLQRQDTHWLNVFISENMLKMDAAVCHIACDLERFAMESRKTKTKVILATNQTKGENL